MKLIDNQSLKKIDSSDHNQDQEQKLNLKSQRIRAQSAHSKRNKQISKIPTQLIVPTINLLMPDSSNRDHLENKDSINNHNSTQSLHFHSIESKTFHSTRPNTPKFTHNFN